MKKFILILFALSSSGILLAQNYYVPELIYFRMHNNTSANTFNFASTPVGTNPAPYSGCVMTSSGEFDTCIQGSAGSGTNGILLGWNCNLGAGNWTISFWVKDLAEVVAGNPVYLFGDPGSSSLRCLYGGFALLNHCMLRGDFGDIDMPCNMPGNYVFHIVYDGSSIAVYKNGVFLTTTPVAITLPTGTGFRVAGYTGGTNSLNSTGKMDEFRLYNRALTAQEVAATWNHELPILVGINTYNNEIPVKYELAQNYPNPFNPNTVIDYSIIKGTAVRLVVYDISGKAVSVLVEKQQSAGNYEVLFDASGVSSGVYFYKIITDEFTQTKKMIVAK